MFFLDVIVEFGVGREAKMNGTSVRIDARECAIWAEESRETVSSIFVLAKTDRAIESGFTMFRCNNIDVCTRIGRKLEVVSANVALEGLMFAKCLVARRVGGASESVLASMCFYMSSQSRIR